MANSQRSNIDIVRGIYQSVEQGGLDGVVSALAEDVVWIEPEGGMYGGTYHGPDEVVENLFTEFGDEWDEFSIEVDRLIADDNTVVALVTHRGTHGETGQYFEAPMADSWDISNGRVVRLQHYVGNISYVNERIDDSLDGSTEGNRALVRDSINALNDRDKNAFAATHTKDVILHDHGEIVRGIQEVTEHEWRLFDGYPDMEYVIENLLVDGNSVACRWLVTGTHEGEFEGIPATGEKIEIPACGVFMIENDEIAEVWLTADRLGALTQIGAIE